MARLAAPLLLMLPLACSSEGETEPGRTLREPNVLIITLDTTRADALGCYGGPDWTTPVLDELSSQGVRFSDARTVTPVTLPSHATCLTGLLPFEHGVRDNSTFRLPDEATTLAELLKDQGYSTGAVMGSFVLHSSFGLAQGFDVYADVPRRQIEVTGRDDERTANEVVDEALELVQGGRLKPPFFLWLHVFDPHWSYEAPEEFLNAAVSATPDADTDLGYLRAQYYAEVMFADRQLGRLLRSLPADVRQNLLTVVVADHGEGLGDHGERTHALQLYDTTVSIPFIVHHPELRAATIGEPVSIADVTPTVLGLLGLESGGFSGLDLAPTVLGGASIPAEREIYAETCTPFYTYGWSPIYALVQNQIKFVEGPKPVAFNLAEDSFERWDVIGQQGPFVDHARGVFKEYAGRTQTSVRVELSAEDVQRFAALGYVGPSGAGEDEPVFWPGRVVEGLRDPKQGLPIQMDTARAMGALRENRLQEAISLIESVVERDPTNPLYLTHAGTIYATANRHAEARDMLVRSLELREDASTRCALAIALKKLQRPAEALEQLRQNVAIHPDHLHTRLAIAEQLAQMQRWDESIEHLDYFLSQHRGQDKYQQGAQRLRDVIRQRTGK